MMYNPMYNLMYILVKFKSINQLPQFNPLKCNTTLKTSIPVTICSQSHHLVFMDVFDIRNKRDLHT